MFILFLAFCKLLDSSSGESFVPNDTVVVAKETTILRCTKQPEMKDVIWNFYNLAEPEIKRTIYSASKVQPEYLNSISIIHNTSIEFHLQINTTSLDHAGVYGCFREFGDEPRAQLTVLVSKPVCRVRGGMTSDDGSTVYVRPGKSSYIECSVKYRGLCGPRTTCRTEDRSVNFYGNNQTSGDPNNIRSYTSIFPILSNRLTVGDRIRCGIYFPCPTSKDDSEVYYSTWLSPIINVTDFEEITTGMMVTKINDTHDESSPNVIRNTEHSDQKAAEEQKHFVLTVALSLAAILVVFALVVIVLACAVVIGYRKRKRHSRGISPNTNNKVEAKSAGNYYVEEENKTCSMYDPYEPIDEARMRSMLLEARISSEINNCSNIEQLICSDSARLGVPLPSPRPEKQDIFSPNHGIYLHPGDRNKVAQT